MDKLGGAVNNLMNYHSKVAESHRSRKSGSPNRTTIVSSLQQQMLANNERADGATTLHGFRNGEGTAAKQQQNETSGGGSEINSNNDH